jgi:UDP-N-acetylglucosamine transferase subunit ALG13
VIFVTVGSQMPFDRLVRAADAWAAAHPQVRCVAQIGMSEFKPQSMESMVTVSPSDFRQLLCEARLIVAHAGMGTVLSALEYDKPIVLMPRWGRLRETRNDHQVATARWLESKRGVYVAPDENDLATKINVALNDSHKVAGGFSGCSSMVEKLRDIVFEL